VLLGPPSWSAAGGEIPFLAERKFQLLAYLAHRADWISRQHLAEVFWPDLGNASARRNLRKLLFRLREPAVLPPIEERPGAVRWAVDTDLAAFEQALAAGELHRALTLWRGEPWQGLGVETLGMLGDWFNCERNRLHAMWRDASLRLAACSSDDQASLTLAARLLERDPLDEEAVRVLLVALVQTGRRGEAHAAYRRFAVALQDALALEPTAQTLALLAEPGPPVSGNRPAPPEIRQPGGAALSGVGFVGRRAELRELAGMLSNPDCRWITITGDGGSGKTSLLRQALLERSANGIHAHVLATFDDLVEAPAGEVDRLGPAEAFTQIGARLAHALGLQLGAHDKVPDRLMQHLRGRPMLLALDNLEQVPAGARALAELLSACPGTQVVATSRVRLALAGEWLLPLQGLPWPAAEDLDCAEAFDATRLFIDRARRFQPQWDARAEMSDVVQLCGMVEGLPLALELAAVWTRRFRVSEIVADLRQGPSQMLAELDESAGRGPRQRSMRASFEHSWRLLVPAEREALAALSVLRGGWSRQAALAVAATTLPVLVALQDKSLLRREIHERAALAERYTLHPLVQQLAAERLAGHAQAREAAERRMAEYFCRELVALPPHSRYAERKATAQGMARDLENTGVAWLQAVALGRGDLLAPALAGLWAVYFHCARWSECMPLLDAAEPVLASRPDAAAQIDAARSFAAYLFGHYEASVSLARRVLRTRSRLTEGSPRTAALSSMGYSLVQLGRLDAARRCFEQGEALARASGHASDLASHLDAQGGLDALIGRYEACLKRQFEALALRRSLGINDPILLNNVGVTLNAARRHEEATVYFNEGLAALGEHPNPIHRAHLNIGLMKMHMDMGNDVLAQAHAASAEHDLAHVASPLLCNFLGLARARLALRRGDTAHARRLVAAVTSDALVRAQVGMLAAAAVVWAEWLEAEGRVEAAATLLAVACAQPALAYDERDAAQTRLHRLCLAAGLAAVTARGELEPALRRLLAAS
jgi:DNA-binding SARP family transcriptional activator/tetratricopeptide (TPR) repeat protein